MASQTYLIVERLMRRDRAALSDLYAETSSKAYGVIVALIDNEQLATQTLRDLYLDIWKAPNTVLGGSLEPARQVLLQARRRAVDLLASDPSLRCHASGKHAATKETYENTGHMLKTAYRNGEALERLAARFDMTSEEAQTRLWTQIIELRGDRA